MKKLVRICITIFILCSILTSCNTTNVINLKNDNLANYVKDLSDDSFEGRLVGTKGNEKAVEYIEKIYKELGLSPYTSESFLQSYKHKVIDFDKNNLISISDENGKQIDFTYGEDFLDASVIPGNFICPIVIDKNYINLSNSFIVLDSEDEIGNFIGKAKGVLVKSKSLKKYTGNYLEKGTPLIQIDEKMFNYLISHKNMSITYNCEYIENEIDANNVIGLIPGSKHEKALILSAHFDHVGVVGKNVYNGAIDNCSGVAVLLDIAKKLQIKAKETPFDFDIYICAFNGEEANLQGSKSFVDYVKNRHSNIVNINLDTLGDKSKEILILGDPKASHTIVHLMSDWLNQNKQKYKIESEKYRSDHISFQEADIPSISLIQECNDIIHSVEDKYEKVDIEFLHYFSNLVYEFINNMNNTIFDIYTKCEHSNEDSLNSEIVEIPENKELEKLVDQVRSKLNFGEYTIINKYNRKERIYKNIGVFKTLNELLSIYPDISSPYKSKDYTLNKITVIDNSFPEISKDIIYDIVYKNELKSSNIGSIDFVYSSKNQNSILTFRLASKDNQPLETSPNSKSEVIKNNKGEQYKLTYNPDGTLTGITYICDDLNINYILTIQKGTIKDLTINNETHKNTSVYDWNIKENREAINELINSVNLNIIP